MTIEDRLRQAMAEEAAATPNPASRWDDVESAAAAGRRTAARRRSGSLAVFAVAVAAGVAALIALPALTGRGGRRVVVTPAKQPTTVAPPTSAPSTSVTIAPPVGAGYQALYPFRSLAEANAWATARANGAQPWHSDAAQTALAFTRFLGYTDITTAYGVRMDSAGAHVTVGFPDPNGRPVSSAVVHLRRFGPGQSAPWEVVGTDDTANFSLITPLYASVAPSPLLVGGTIMGVDESIRVEVLQPSSPTPLGVFCCLPAGNSGKPWGATVTIHGATDPVLIVAASTGGHIATVERFTVTAVRTTRGSTPGL